MELILIAILAAATAALLVLTHSERALDFVLGLFSGRASKQAEQALPDRWLRETIAYAVASGRPQSVRRLLEEGADIQTQVDGKLLISIAVMFAGYNHENTQKRQERIEVCKLLLNAGLTANADDLRSAATDSNLELFRLLLSSRADWPKDEIQALLRSAALSNNMELFRLLLSSRTDWPKDEIQDLFHSVLGSLHLATEDPHAQAEMCRMLIAAGADVNGPNSAITGAISGASHKPIHRATSGEVVRTLIEYGANIHSTYGPDKDYSFNALDAALLNTGVHPKLLSSTCEALLDAGLDPHSVHPMLRDQPDWRTTLERYCAARRREALKAYVARPAEEEDSSRRRAM